jgi:hypothetical protein
MNRKTKCLLCALLAGSSAAFGYSSHSLVDTNKIGPNSYEGTAGKTHLLLTTKECYHETLRGGEASNFVWYTKDGSITFASNADQCTVTAYKEK